MKTFLQARANDMRAFVPLVMMIVPGTAYAQVADGIVPSAIAPWTDEIAPSAALADIAAQISPSEILLQADAPFDVDTLAVKLPAIELSAIQLAAELASAAPLAIEPAAAAETVAAADMSAADTAAADAQSNAGAPVALAEQADAMFGAPPVSEGELAETKGKAGIDNGMVAIANSSSNVTNNRIGNNSVTGGVNISDNAFQGASGFSIVNINTGGQSSIVSGMSVVLQINYAPQGQ